MINLRSSRWLRIVAIAILTITISQAQAQVQTARYISMGPNTNGFYEYLPQGYNPNSSEKYPVIIFIHGIGELGDGSQWALPRILYTGLPAVINYGQFPTSFNVNGQNHKFIVISPQFINWPSPTDVEGVINYVTNNYRVNTNKIYLTGLSMGGGVVWDYCGANTTYGNRVAAIVPVCGASWPDHARARTIANANVPVWALHNTYDPTVNISYTNMYVDYINEAPSPNPRAKKSVFESWSHDAWTNTYNSTYRDETGKSVFEWMLQFSRGSSTPVPSNQLPVSNAGPDQNVTGTSAQLNGSGWDPDGSISSYTWSQLSGPSNATFSNANIANPSITSLIPGTYSFRLTAKDNVYASAYDDVTINVAAPPATAVTLPGRVQAENYVAMYGIQSEPTADAGGGQDIGWQDNGDWMDYTVNAPSTGVYTVNFRVATMFSGPQFQLRRADGTALATINVPNTGNFQSWQTVSASVNLSAGQQNLRIYTTYANGGWNMNWMEFAHAAVNQLPVVSAGAAQSVTLPASSTTLTGTATDADGWIASYAWSQVSGPSTASINNATSATTSVSALVQGSYTFRFKGTDNTGASATSDVTVNVVAGSTQPSTSSTKIEAENYTGMYGIQKENTSDAGGGQNVAWQDNGDWMDYSFNAATAGTFTVNFRVATMFSGAQFQLRKQDGSVLATVTVPNTGNFQSWQTVSASVYLAAGQQTLRIVTTQANGGWNINWLEIVGSVSAPSLPATNIKIEAENYTGMYGIQKENTSDAGGGQNVAWQDNGDWMDYSFNAATAGTFTVNFRVATMFSGAQFQLRKQDGSVLATVTVPNTGNFQSWQTVSASVYLAAGSQTVRIVTTQANGGWNINWLEIVGAGSPTTRAAAAGVAEEVIENTSASFQVFPNPVQDRFLLQLTNDFTGVMKVQLINMGGAVQKQFTINKQNKGAMQTYLSIGGVQAGEYILNVISGSKTETKKLIKL